MCFGFALLNRSLEELDYTACNKTRVIVWRQCILSNNFYHKSAWIPIYKYVCTLKKRIKRKWGQSLPITGLEPTTSAIRGECLNHCATDVNIYILAYTSVTIIIYLFNINSRKLDGQYRSWIEYLNEPYEVCILDM